MDDILKKIIARREALKTERGSWDATYRELQHFIMPRRGRFSEGERNKGQNKNKNIINGASTIAAGTLSAGLMSTLTNPSRRWFKLQPTMRGLEENLNVSNWLDTVQDILYDTLRRSNFYTEVNNLYTELGTFGTGVMTYERNFDTIIHFTTATVGEYYLANGGTNYVNTMFRDLQMSVGQIVERFGYDKVPSDIQRACNKGTLDTWKTVYHAIEPLKKRNAAGHKFRSTFWMAEGNGSGNQGTLLSVKGFADFPAFTPRWDLRPTDIYGRGPGHDALNDAKQLQFQERNKATGIGMQVRPPISAPTSLKGQPIANVPGGIVYTDPTGVQGQIGALTNVRPDVNALNQDIDGTVRRINRFYYADLFAAMLNMPDRTYMSATEASQRFDERLILLGPVLQRLNPELLDPVLSTVFKLLLEEKLIPEPPPELKGQPIRVDYVSLLHQAQQAVGAASIERSTAFITSLAAADPTVLDIFDADTTARTYNMEVGAPAKMMRDPEEVAAKRQQEAEARAAQQSLSMMQQGAQTAETLAKADMSGQNVLTEMTGG